MIVALVLATAALLLLAPAVTGRIGGVGDVVRSGPEGVRQLLLGALSWSDECADESFGAAGVEVGFAGAGAEEVAAVVLLGHADLDGLGKTSRP